MCFIGVPRQAGPDESDAPEISQCELPPARHSTRLNESVRIRDLWHVLDRARTDGASRTLAVAQDEVFRRYLPMARTLAAGVGAGGRPGGPAAAEQAAEIGLAQAVLGWRRSDSTGFELSAHIAIAAQLDRLSTAATSLTGDRSFPVVG